MKKIIYVLLAIFAHAAFASHSEVLVAKCGFGVDMEGIIQPGSAFYYILKSDDQYFAISGIAHRRDKLADRTQPLRGELPLLAVEYEHGIPRYWLQPSFLGRQAKSYIAVPLDISQPVETMVGSGGTALTDYVYPTCVVWRH